MRAVRASLIGAVVLALVGGLGGSVLSESDVDPMAPAYFTFTRGMASESIGGEVEGIDSGGIPALRGQVEVDIPVEASDPRASGVWTFAINADAVEVAGGIIDTAATSHRLVNADGAWTGAGRTISVFGDDGNVVAGLTVLTGEGGYEGLRLILSQSFDDGVESYWGIILLSDKMPPFPDPIEPTGE